MHRKLSAIARAHVARDAWAVRCTRERYLDLLRERHIRFMEDERASYPLLASSLFVLFVVAPLCALLWSL